MSETIDIQHTDQSILDKIGLTVDSALICRLGYENAYDADARKVEVYFKDTGQLGGTITVKDNGTGMDFDKLKNGFLRISTADKVDNPTSERYYYGIVKRMRRECLV